MALSADDIMSPDFLSNSPNHPWRADHETTNNVVQTLDGNAASLSAASGGGAHHGCAGIIVTPALRATLTATTPRMAAGRFAQIPNQATTAVRKQLTQQRKEARKISNDRTNADSALEGRVISTITSAFLCKIRNNHAGFLGCATLRDLLDHLINRCGKITPADLEINKKRASQPTDSVQMIGVFLRRIDDCTQHEDDGKEAPLMQEQVHQATWRANSA